MRSLTIEARSRESAEALHNALSKYRPLLLCSAESYMVKVELPSDDGDLIAVLDTLERHVSERNSSARLKLDGTDYTFHGESREAR
jgi:hypothetical protein